MKIVDLNSDGKLLGTATKLHTAFAQLQELISLLNEKTLRDPIMQKINTEVAEINASQLNGNSLHKLIKHKQAKIIKLVEKELKIVPIDYYKNMWSVLGMTLFGLPIGAAIGISIGNLGLLAVGLPLGLGIGYLLGTSMDKKAATDGRQLAITLK